MDTLNRLRQQVREDIASQPAIQRVMQGAGDAALYKHYLINVWHYAQHSSTVIGLAAARCVQGHPGLADYLFHHAREELGHERWALDDLNALGVSPEAVRKTRPVPACAAMIGFEYYTAMHANPVGLFGWLFVLEAMGDDLGGVVSEMIEESLSLPHGVKFLRGHGVADEEHTKDIIDKIRVHVQPADMVEVEQVAVVIADLYPRMFQEIAGRAAREAA